MTVATASRQRLSNSRSLLAAASPVTPWVRPSAWLSLPDVTGQQRFAGLHRIDVDGNFVALTAAGAYTVDWGDGTTTNHATGTTAQKQYDYTTISSAGESTLGYRQVIIQVYPQSGQNLTSLSLAVRHSTTSVAYATGWLDVLINASSITSLVFSSATITARYLQQATVLQHNLTSTSGMFSTCTSLQSVPLFNTASVTNMGTMFFSCTSLRSVPLFNTASVTSMSSMFNTCSSLSAVPLFNTALVTNFGSMFQSCPSFQSVPLFSMGSATSTSNMFFGNSSLQAVPLFNLSAATNTSGMFTGCGLLAAIPAFNLSSATNVNTMFNNCASLASLPSLNLSAVSSAANMASFASGCSSLASVACTGINQTVSFASCKLSAAQIDAIFTNLASSGSGKTITVTGNYGAATCTQSIATSKGWTVAV
jgi:surface protein